MPKYQHSSARPDLTGFLHMDCSPAPATPPGDRRFPQSPLIADLERLQREIDAVMFPPRDYRADFARIFGDRP